MAQYPPDDPIKENADSLAGEIGVQGIEALPNRINRYGKAKKTALDVVEYIDGESAHQDRNIAIAQRYVEKVRNCGDYLLFRNYPSVDQVRLHGASLCKKHLLCPLCAIRRGAVSLKNYLTRWDVIRSENTLLKAYLVTLTVKDGDDLAERFNHLHKSQRELWMRKHRGRGSALDGVLGAVWSYEVKRGKNSGAWHPHLHMIAIAENPPSQAEISAEWHSITGDSFVVDVRPISQEDPASGFIEVFKYAVKFSDQAPADTVHAFATLSGKRLLASSGCFRGVVDPDSLLDPVDDLAGVPYFTMFYRFLGGAYRVSAQSQWGVEQGRREKRAHKPPIPLSEDRLARLETGIRLSNELHERRLAERRRLARWESLVLSGGLGAPPR